MSAAWLPAAEAQAPETRAVGLQQRLLGADGRTRKAFLRTLMASAMCLVWTGVEIWARLQGIVPQGAFVGMLAFNIVGLLVFNAAVRSGSARFRLGGMVAAHSFRRGSDSLQAHFEVTDGDAQLPVVYTGILPDLFREEQAVIATGRMHGKVFVAEEVLAKHDETYMPKELADKMGAAHKRHGVQDGAEPAMAQSPTVEQSP